MDLIPRVSYAKDFIETFKKYFESDQYNGDCMDCADMFRHSEWKVIDDADYGKNTRNDLYDLAGNDSLFKSFIDEVISCMEYNRSMEME